MLGVVESVALVLELAIVLVCLSNLFDKHIKADIYTILLVVVYLFIFSVTKRGDLPAYIAIIA